MAIDRRQFLLTASVSAAPALAQQTPKRLARKDCYFGLHFDLHPSESDTALGRDVTNEMVDQLLARVGPDYVQYDCKGHVGYLGYPSKVGTSAPGIVKDSLEIWRRMTTRRGAGLYIHFSGVWDGVAVSQHPEWARVQPDGKPDDRNTSTFGPYVDALMIPQLSEAIEKYGLDGVWVDGECWSTAPDYSDAAQRAWRERTGSGVMPRSAKDPGWLDFLEFNRQQFRKYVKHYVDELHRKHPGVEIASNWLYSSFVPERPDIPVDYLSGDFLGATPISTAHVEARYLAATGKPWDLMAWGFVVDRTANTKIHKTAVQLKQEAAAVISQGGGFEVYYNPTRAGFIDEHRIGIMEDLGRFCRERKDVSFQSEAVPQVGVLFSQHSLYATSNRMFGSWGGSTNPARGAIDALLAAHHSVDILPDWNIAEAAKYPIIVVPDWPDIGAATRDALIAYARSGGNLVLLGAGNAAAFADATGVLAQEPREEDHRLPRIGRRRHQGALGRSAIAASGRDRATISVNGPSARRAPRRRDGGGREGKSGRDSGPPRSIVREVSRGPRSRLSRPRGGSRLHSRGSGGRSAGSRGRPSPQGIAMAAAPREHDGSAGRQRLHHRGLRSTRRADSGNSAFGARSEAGVLGAGRIDSERILGARRVSDHRPAAGYSRRHGNRTMRRGKIKASTNAGIRHEFLRKRHVCHLRRRSGPENRLL